MSDVFKSFTVRPIFSNMLFIEFLITYHLVILLNCIHQTCTHFATCNSQSIQFIGFFRKYVVQLLFTLQLLRAVGVLFSPMMSGWAGGRSDGLAGGRTDGRATGNSLSGLYHRNRKV